MHAVPNVHFIYVLYSSSVYSIYIGRRFCIYIYIIISLNLRKEQQEQKSKEQ